MANFEVVKRFNKEDINLPIRKTKYSAGYDFEAAEDILIPSIHTLFPREKHYTKNIFTLEEMGKYTKQYNAKPTLVPTGIKAKLNNNQYLELSVRSSCPLKYWLILANGIGIIDADYYNNPDNEGEIFFQLINLSPFDIQLKKGDTIGQGIIKTYQTVKGDSAEGVRAGGFGSSDQG